MDDPSPRDHTFFAITARMVTPLLLLVQSPFIGSACDGDVQAAVDVSIPVGQWLGWIISLAIAERVIRRWRTPHAPRLPA